MIISIAFVIIEIFFLVNLMKIKLTDRTVAVSAQIPLAFVFVMSFHAMIAGLLSLGHIDINLYSIGFFDLIMSIVIFSKCKRTGSQKYEITGKNYLFYILLTIGVLLFGLFLFGRNLEIHFWSVDASAHYGMAQYVVQNQSFNTNLYFSALNNGIAMMIAKPFMGEQYLYKVFIIMELWDFWLAILMFYELLMVIKSDSNKLVAGIFSFFYAVGYPMYAIIFGFSYFGASITLITACIFLLEINSNGSIGKKYFTVALNLLIFSLFVCYTYFIPVICVTIFIYLILVEKFKNGYINTKKMITEECKVFLLPVIFGMFFSATNISELGSGGGITNEGGCYLNFYSNFIFLAFFCIYGFCLSKNRSKMLSVRVLSLFSLVFFLILLVMFYNGRVSMYYLSKIYNLLWLEYFLLSYYAVVSLDNNFQLIKKGIAVGTALICFTTIINYLPYKTENLNVRKSVKLTAIPDIYVFNSLGFFQEYVSDGLIQSFWKVKETYENSDSIIAIGDEVKCGWFKTVFEDSDTISYDLNILDDTINKDTKYLYCIESTIVNSNLDKIEKMGTVIYKDLYSELIELK